MRPTMLRLASLAVVGLGLSLGAAAGDPDLVDAAARLQRFRDDCRGSAVATKRRLLEDLRADLYGRPARFSGTVWSLASVSLTGGEGSGADGGALVTWEFEGMKLPPAGAGTVAELIADRFPGATEATLVIVREGDLQLYGLVVDRQLVDRLRKGAAAAVTFETTGLRETSLAGVITGLEAPSRELVCPEGHRFDAATGYRFCPFCGHPLSPATPNG